MALCWWGASCGGWYFYVHCVPYCCPARASRMLPFLSLFCLGAGVGKVRHFTLLMVTQQGSPCGVVQGRQTSRSWTAPRKRLFACGGGSVPVCFVPVVHRWLIVYRKHAYLKRQPTACGSCGQQRAWQRWLAWQRSIVLHAGGWLSA